MSRLITEAPADMDDFDDDGHERRVSDSGCGEFFAVDRRTWARACSLGMNTAAVYLVLARGTARDNRTTAWSVQAVEKYTSISRGRAQQALELLAKNSLVEVLRESTRPKYRLRPAHEVPGCEGYPPPTLDALEERLFEQLRSGKTWVAGKGSKTWGYSNPRTIAESLVRKGWALDEGDNCFKPIVYDAEAAAQTDWIWLPNELVTGAAGEVPPVELVRQTQDVMTLRLLVDLYHAQNLRDDGGVSRAVTRRSYERFEVGRQAQFTIWGFRHENGSVTWIGPTLCHKRAKLSPEEVKAGKNPGVDYFRREGQLAELGLIEWVPTLVEGEGPDAEIIHPCAMANSGSLEDRLGRAAHDAALSMLTDRQHEWAAEQELRLTPVPRHITNVPMIGIARLRYRPKTRKTAAWWADLQAKGEGFLRKYEALSAAPDLAIAVGA
jgi:hypothetical protein